VGGGVRDQKKTKGILDTIKQRPNKNFIRSDVLRGEGVSLSSTIKIKIKIKIKTKQNKVNYPGHWYPRRRVEVRGSL